MGFDVVTAYILVVSGLALVLVAAVTIHSRDINTRAAVAAIQKLLRAGNVDRARKLTKAAPRSFFDAIHAALIAGAESTSRDRTVLESLVLPAFERTGRDLLAQRKARTDLGLVGAVLAVGAVALAGQAGSIPTPVLVLGGIAVLVGTWVWLRRGRLANDLAITRNVVMPAILDALATAPAPVVPAPAKPGTSLRDGTCPLCGNARITRLAVADARIHRLVCAACGYTQEFADLSRLA